MAQNRELGELGQLIDANTSSNTLSVNGSITVGSVTINSSAVSVSGQTINGSSLSLGSSGLSANGSFGSAGEVLHSNGTATYWATDDQGVTSVSGTSGRITSSGGNTPAIDLATAGAGAASYSSGISALTVDAYGRVTSVTGSASYATTTQLASYLPLAGGTMTGTLSIGTGTNLSFGAATRQMINLYNADYAIGIQNNTQYYRSQYRFSWHRGGVHSGTENDPGTGGTVAMTLDSSSHLTAFGSMRSPIFYDSDNTAYYVDPANGGFNLVGGTSNRVSFTTNDSGLFVGNPEGNGVTVRLGAAYGRPGLYSPTYLSLMADSSQYIEFVTNNVQRGYIDNGAHMYALGSMRSPIFYDSDNTGYYLNPADVSYLVEPRMAWRSLIGNQNYDGTLYDGGYEYRPGITIRGNYPHLNLVSSGINNTAHGPTLRFMAYDTAGATSGNYKHWVIGCAGTNATRLSIGYASNNANPHEGIYGWGTSAMWFENDSNVYCNASIRPTILYDRDNTGYYLDPNSYSSLYRGEFRGYSGSVSSGGAVSLEIENGGGTGDSNVAAIAFHCAGAYAMHMHLRADGYFGIGGWSAPTWKSYWNTNSGGEFVNSGPIYGNIYYDGNDSAFYCDPNGTTRINNLTVVGTGGKTLIQTLTASNSPSLATTNCFSTAYKYYMVVFNNLLATNGGTAMYMRLYISGAYQASNYRTYTFAFNIGGSAGYAPTTYIDISGSTRNRITSGDGYVAHMIVFNPGASIKTRLQGHYNVYDWNIDGIAYGTFNAEYLTAAPCTGFQVYASSGNIASGEIQIYGWN